MKSWQWVGLTATLCAACGIVGFEIGRSPPRARPGASEPHGDVLASYDGRVIRTSELEDRLSEDGPLLRGQVKNPKLLSQYLREWIRLELLAKGARDSGLADKPEIRREYERRLADAYLQANLLRDASKNPLTDQELHAYFDAHRAEYERPERFELAEVYFAPNGNPALAQKRAQSALEKLRKAAQKDPYAFDTLARTASDEPEARIRGGRLPVLTRAQVEARFGPQVLGQLTAAKPDTTLASPVPDGNGYALVRVVRHADAVSPSFDTLRSVLRARMAAESKKRSYDAFMDELEKRAHVTIHDDTVASAATSIR